MLVVAVWGVPGVSEAARAGNVSVLRAGCDPDSPCRGEAEANSAAGAGSSLDTISVGVGVLPWNGHAIVCDGAAGCWSARRAIGAGAAPAG